MEGEYERKEKKSQITATQGRVAPVIKDKTGTEGKLRQTNRGL